MDINFGQPLADVANGGGETLPAKNNATALYDHENPVDPEEKLVSPIKKDPLIDIQVDKNKQEEGIMVEDRGENISDEQLKNLFS